VGAYVGWVAAKKPPNHIPVTPGNSKKYPVRGCDHGWIYNHTFHTLTTEVIIGCDVKSYDVTKNVYGAQIHQMILIQAIKIQCFHSVGS
jgi:hypothetical protein